MAEPADIDATRGNTKRGDAKPGDAATPEARGPAPENRVPDYAENFEHALRRLTIEKAALKAGRKTGRT